MGGGLDSPGCDFCHEGEAGSSPHRAVTSQHPSVGKISVDGWKPRQPVVSDTCTQRRCRGIESPTADVELPSDRSIPRKLHQDRAPPVHLVGSCSHPTMGPESHPQLPAPITMLPESPRVARGVLSARECDGTLGCRDRPRSSGRPALAGGCPGDEHATAANNSAVVNRRRMPSLHLCSCLVPVSV